MDDIFTSKEKDEILNACDTKDRQVQINTFTDEGRKLKAVAELLQNEGYISLTGFKGGAVYWITGKGLVLKSKGGFSGLEKDKTVAARKEKWKTYFWNGLFFALGVTFTKLIDMLLPLLVGK